MAVSETLNVGDISPKRYIATRNVENTVETQRLRQKAEESVGELYKHDPDVAVNAKEQIDSFFESVDSAIAEMKIEAGQEAARKNALSRIGGNEVNAVPEYNYAINPAVSIPIYFSPVQYEEYDKLIADSVTEMDEQARIDNYKRCQEILTEQAVGVYICDPNLVVASRKDLKGYTFYPVTFHDMTKLYYEG